MVVAIFRAEQKQTMITILNQTCLNTAINYKFIFLLTGNCQYLYKLFYQISKKNIGERVVKIKLENPITIREIQDRIREIKT